MSRLTDGAITVDSPHSVEVSFSGTDAFSYVNGLQVTGPNTGTTVIPFGADDVFALEIHDLQINEDTPNYSKRPVHPEIIWSAVSNAEQYRIYHTPPGGAEVLIYIQMPGEGRKVYHLRVPVECGRGWNFFRVEGVDSNGTESTRVVWPEYVYDLPDAPDSVELSGSSGTFSIAVA